MTVKGSQGDLAATKLELAERGVNNLPGQLEGLAGRHLGQLVEQGSDTAAGREHGNVLLMAGQIENTVQASLHTLDKTRPAFQLRGVVSAADPARNDQIEDALEFFRLMGGIFQRVQGFWFMWQEAREQGIKHREGVELIEGRVYFQIGRSQSGGRELGQRMPGGILLAQQIT